MLQAHSLLWSSLWVVPNLLLLLLAFIIWKRGLAHQSHAFLAFAIVSGIGDLTVFFADVSPSISGPNFWRIDWVYLIAESLFKFAVIADVFSKVLNPYPSISRLGRASVRWFGAACVLLAALAAAFSRGDSTLRLISGCHVLEQTVFIVEVGLIIFIFAFASYFRLTLDRLSFGILLGFGVSASGHLVAWAILANAAATNHQRVLLDLVNMSTHQVCIAIWYYYWLVPGKNPQPKKRTKPPGPHPLPGSNPREYGDALNDWNRELERFIHQ